MTTREQILGSDLRREPKLEPKKPVGRFDEPRYFTRSFEK